MSEKISHSRLELYKQCPFKYKLQYIDNWEADKTFGALLLGKSLDSALNELLIQKKNRAINGPIVPQKAHDIFQEAMDLYKGQNEFIFFKNELPIDYEIEDPAEAQIAAFQNLVSIGHKMVDVYNEKILSQFDEIVDVQIEKKITNEDGDVFTMIIDFIARIGDKIIVFDNKTTSDLKKQYTEKSTFNSQQLNLYFNQCQEIATHIGYIPLQKKLVKNEIIYDIIITEANPAKADEAYEELATTLDKIKAKEFEKNEKSCWAFGKRCPYFGLCKNGNSEGLIKREPR